MKQFTRHTFRTKCNINFHLFFLRSAYTIVLASLITYIHTSHMFRIIYDSLRTCNFNFFIAFSCFSCANHHSGDRNLWKGGEQHVCLATLLLSHLHAAFSWTRPFQFQDSRFPKFCWPIFSICPCSATAVHFLFQ